MKRILQKKTIGIALILVLVLAAAVPALAASTCNASSAQPCSLSSEEILAKLEACGLSISQLEKYGTCPNSATNTDDTQVASANIPASTKTSTCPTGNSASAAACTQADCSANGCDAADCSTGSCTKSSCAQNQCVSADDNAVASAVVPKETSDVDSIKDAVSNYVADKSSCPTGSSSSPTGSSSCPTGSSSSPKNDSAVKSANIADIQAAAQKLIDQATSQSGSSCDSAKAADILNQLQNSGLYSCNK